MSKAILLFIFCVLLNETFAKATPRKDLMNKKLALSKQLGPHVPKWEELASTLYKKEKPKTLKSTTSTIKVDSINDVDVASIATNVTNNVTITVENKLIGNVTDTTTPVNITHKITAMKKLQDDRMKQMFPSFLKTVKDASKKPGNTNSTTIGDKMASFKLNITKERPKIPEPLAPTLIPIFKPLSNNNQVIPQPLADELILNRPASTSQPDPEPKHVDPIQDVFNPLQNSVILNNLNSQFITEKATNKSTQANAVNAIQHPINSQQKATGHLVSHIHNGVIPTQLNTQNRTIIQTNGGYTVVLNPIPEEELTVQEINKLGQSYLNQVNHIYNGPAQNGLTNGFVDRLEVQQMPNIENTAMNPLENVPFSNVRINEFYPSFQTNANGLNPGPYKISQKFNQEKGIQTIQQNINPNNNVIQLNFKQSHSNVVDAKEDRIKVFENGVTIPSQLPPDYAPLQIYTPGHNTPNNIKTGINFQFIPAKVNTVIEKHAHNQNTQFHVNDIPIQRSGIVSETNAPTNTAEAKPSSAPIASSFNIPCHKASDILEEFGPIRQAYHGPQNNKLNSIPETLKANLQCEKPILVDTENQPEDESVAIVFKPKNISLLKFYGDLLKKITLTVLVPYHISKLTAST